MFGWMHGQRVGSGGITGMKRGKKDGIEMVAASPIERFIKIAIDAYCTLRRRWLKQLHDVVPPDKCGTLTDV
jgi:hypothetical protein